MSPVLAEITDNTLWQALGVMGAFVGGIIWWVLKDFKSQREENKKQDVDNREFEKEKLTAQIGMNFELQGLTDTLKDHMTKQDEHSEEIKSSIHKLCTTNEKLVGSISEILEIKKVG